MAEMLQLTPILMSYLCCWVEHVLAASNEGWWGLLQLVVLAYIIHYLHFIFTLFTLHLLEFIIMVGFTLDRL